MKRICAPACPGIRVRDGFTYLHRQAGVHLCDGTHAIAAARIAADELGFNGGGPGQLQAVNCREVRAAAKRLGLEP